MSGRRSGTGALARWLLMGGIAGLIGACAPHHSAPSSQLSSAPARPTVIISARPAYRLIVDPTLADVASRLVVLHARIETLGADRLRISPTSIDLTLADGTVTHAFDQTRALALLERTQVAVWNLEYTYDDQHRYPPGGLKEPTRRRVKEGIADRVLGDVDVTRDQPVEGFLIIDTHTPLTSLAGTTLGVSASRLSDATPVRDTFQFAASERASASK